MVVGPRGLGNSPLRRPGEDRTGVALVGGPGVVPSDLGVLFLTVGWLVVPPVFRRGDSSPVWIGLKVAVRREPLCLRVDFIAGAFIWVTRHLRIFLLWISVLFDYMFICVLCTRFSYVSIKREIPSRDQTWRGCLYVAPPTCALNG